jgi:hypothetical protein
MVKADSGLEQHETIIVERGMRPLGLIFRNSGFWASPTKCTATFS